MRSARRPSCSTSSAERRWRRMVVISKAASLRSARKVGRALCRRRSSHAGAAMTSRSDRGPPPTSRVITSLTNDRVKLIRSLDMRKTRRETGLFVAEGASVLMTARENGWRPQILAHGAEARESPAHCGLIDWALGEGTEGLEVSRAVLEK